MTYYILSTIQFYKRKIELITLQCFYVFIKLIPEIYEIFPSFILVIELLNSIFLSNKL
jgi:hypothetical protein